ncbi:MAG TPA: NAD(P)-binding protein, partial [Tenuifilaceae bacterium]|nr:NAD(P)-binding protein [Tenuifilaceae bacterium]
MKKISTIGAGIGGLATTIRLASKGYGVTVFEQQPNVGGKLNQFKANGFRFDTGPSLFTLPNLVDELIKLSANKQVVLPYKKLEV